MKNSFKSYCSYFLFFFLCACGVKGPLFFPPPSPTPNMPSKPEPIGKIYPLEKNTTVPTTSSSPISNEPSQKTQPSDNIKNVPTPLK